MTTRERATLAFRIAGVYHVAVALNPLTRVVGFYLDHYDFINGQILLSWGTARWAAWPLAVGVLLFVFAGRLSGLVTRALDDAAGPVWEATTIGTTMVAVYYLVRAVRWPLAMLRAGRPEWVFGAILPGALGVALIAVAPRVAAWARTRRRTMPEAASGQHATLLVGLLVTSIWFACSAAVQLALIPVYLRQAAVLTPMAGGSGWVARQAIPEALTLAMAVACAVFAARIAGRRVRRSHLPPGSHVLPAAPGPWTCLAAALLLAAFYHLPDAIRFLGDPRLLGLGFLVGPGRIAWAIVLTGLVGAAIAFAGGAVARWLAARVYRPDPDGPAERASGRLILEVGMTLVLLWHFIMRAALVVTPLEGAAGGVQLRWQSSAYWLPLALTLALLAFRGDIARIWMPGAGPEGPHARRRRAAALDAWLALLGVWTLLDSVPGAVSQAGKLGSYLSFWPEAGLPSAFVRVVLVAGLVVLAGPLSRLLSFGPVLLRKRPEPAGE